MGGVRREGEREGESESVRGLNMRKDPRPNICEKTIMEPTVHRLMF